MQNQENEYRGIKSWSYDERPREKMLQKGASSLSNAELLAILIAKGTQKQTAIDLARLLLAKSQNSLLQLGKFSPLELSSLTKGIGMAKAVTIAAALEIGRRRSDELPSQQIVFSSSEQVASVFRPMLADLPHEEFWILLLSRTNKAIAKYRVAVGGVHQTTVDVRLVLKHALLHLASAVVLCHNHPSGSRMPSLADKNLTKQIIEAARWMEIKILDHIIIAGDSYYSFSDENTLTL